MKVPTYGNQHYETFVAADGGSTKRGLMLRAMLCLHCLQVVVVVLA